MAEQCMMPGYGEAIDELVKRILDFIPKYPEILVMDDPWQLFKIPGFTCDDLGPSLAQAG